MRQIAVLLCVCLLSSSCGLLTVVDGTPEYYKSGYKLPENTSLQTGGYYVFRSEYCSARKQAFRKQLATITHFQYLRFLKDGNLAYCQINKENAAKDEVPVMINSPRTWGFYKLDGDTLRIEIFTIGSARSDGTHWASIFFSRTIVTRHCQKLLISTDSLIPLEPGLKDKDYCPVKNSFVVSGDSLNMKSNRLLNDKVIRRQLKLDK